MARRVLLLLLPLALVALVEVALRLGAWEPLAAPQSHAGQAIRMKRLWNAHRGPIDTVTLGSSRAAYGLDHAMLAEAARKRGQVHATFALGGAHWLSTRAESRWIERHRPEVRHRVIALSLADFKYSGNGPYELALVEPLRRWSDATWIGEHVAFDRGDIATYGVYSSLMQYRADIADFLADPGRRFLELARDRELSSVLLFDSHADAREICALDTRTLKTCALNNPTAPPALQFVRDQCRGLRGAGVVQRTALRTGPDGGPITPMLQGRDMMLEELRQPYWRGRTTVLLMPIHHFWMNEIEPEGVREWVNAWLRPLVEDGTIDVLDYSDFFDRDGVSDCHFYMDVFHQNRPAAAALTKALLPKLEAIPRKPR